MSAVVLPPRASGLRIALIKLSSLGDVVHALPVAHALRVRFPEATLTWVVEQREQAILAGNPDLDDIVPVDTRVWRREFRRLEGLRTVVLKVRGLARRLRAGRFDMAVDLQGLWKSGVVTALTRAPLRIGFAARHCREAGNALFTTHRVPVPPGARHVVEHYLGLLSVLGIDGAEIARPMFPIAPDPLAEGVISRYLEKEGVTPSTPLLALNPGSGREGKRWTIGAYRRLGDDLSTRLGARTIICWGPGEEPLARAIAHGMREVPLILPPTSVSELVALLRRASLVVGGDTGPIHVAGALGVPTVGLYGPTLASRNGPYGSRVATVQSPTGGMDGITVESVLAAAEGLIGSPSAGAAAGFHLLATPPAVGRPGVARSWPAPPPTP